VRFIFSAAAGEHLIFDHSALCIVAESAQN